ncbi:MAG: hypothetical protein PHD36_09220 [Desulfotomaculaceae bacterium]|nr:hypothetical protein [Desulfotomaculaceae bacterium]
MKVISAIAAGLISSLLLCLLVYLVIPKAFLLVLMISWAVFSLLFYQRAKTPGIIWSRACLIAALECLAIPPASRLLPFFCGQQTVQTAKQSAYQAGRDFGAAFGGGLVNLLSGSAGILVGLLLLFIAYYALKPARRK